MRKGILVVSILALSLLPVQAEEEKEGGSSECDRLWTVAGAGRQEPWLRENGFEIGMTKMEASQIRRSGLRGNIAQDEWTFVFPGGRIVLVFEDDTLVSAGFIIEGRDYQEAYAPTYEAMGAPDDFGEKYLLWRSEKCDTVKLLQNQGSDVHVVIQSIDYFKKNSVSKK